MLGRHFAFVCSLTALAAALVGAVLAAAPSSTQATFPGDNGKIAFATNRDGNYEIYAMNPDGSSQTNLTNDAANDSGPAWYPNGSKIAFTSDRDGNDEVYVMNSDGSGVTRLTNNAARDFDPAWSPDGSKIAFASTRDHAEPELYVMNADGSGTVRLTNNTVSDTHPEWSPAGTLIAFTRPIFTQVGYIDEVWTMAPDGSKAAPQDTQTLNMDPSWAPGGSPLAFSRLYSPFVNFEVHAGGTRLTNVNGPDVMPAWSPDGARIAFSSARDDADPDNCAPNCNQEIYVMNANGSGQTRLTSDAAVDTEPDWQPAGVVGGAAGLPDVDRIAPAGDATAGPGLIAILVLVAAAAAGGGALLAWRRVR